MTEKELLQKTIKIVNNTCPEDNYNRAKAAFKNRNPEDFYGESGMRCGDILETYKKQVDEKNEIVAYLTKLLNNSR